MKIILLQDVKNIGKKDDIKEVNDGYAINFLIPRKLAVQSTQRSLQILAAENKAKEEEIERQRQEAEKTRELLKDITLEFKAKAAPDGRMLGTISNKQIEEEILKVHNIKIDKRKFIDKYPVNAFGFTRLKIELFKGVVGTVNIHVSEDK